MFEKFIRSGAFSLQEVLFRSFHKLSHPVISVKLVCPCAQLSLVRHRKTPVRKPSWMPRAKTKLFVFPEIKTFAEDELDQIRELQSFYSSQMESIMAYCAAENKKRELKDAEEHSTVDYQDFLQLLKINDEENERVRRIREAVRAAELESETLALIDQDKAEKEWHAAKEEEVKTIVEYEKAESAKFITLDNIEQAISEAIDNPVNYNFAIDSRGSILSSERLEGSPYWTDDIPRERLENPPSRTPAVQKKWKRVIRISERRWC